MADMPMMKCGHVAQGWLTVSEGESKGTDMMIDLARKAGIATYVISGGEVTGAT